tara:strand:+ start:6817 stop:7887 length:1071 start_codon:yes stop_codon:yes gene_type:complete
MTSTDMHFIDWPVYSIDRIEKEKLFIAQMKKLVHLHKENCYEYKSILEAHDFKDNSIDELDKIPWIHVGLFKHYILRSIEKVNIHKTLYSSGTTGQNPSQIILDKETSILQTKALVNITQNFLGKERLPMLIIDHPNVISQKESFTARGAGIIGLSRFGRDHTYALNDDMSLNKSVFENFINKYKGQKKFIFGFTFMIWKYLICQLIEKDISYDFNNSILVHSGGWKKMNDIAVDNKEFKEGIKRNLNIAKVHNFYGMVEQVGSIFFECEEGFLHAPSFADVLVRNPITFSLCKFGKLGLIQVMSCLPKSYPGHSLLTEDLGTIHGEDDCACGRKGKYFTIKCRVPSSEKRGCSDT